MNESIFLICQCYQPNFDWTPIGDIIRSYLPVQLDNATIRDAVRLWKTMPEECKLKYGDISEWNVSNVTDMSNLFEGQFMHESVHLDLNQWQGHRHQTHV